MSVKQLKLGTKQVDKDQISNTIDLFHNGGQI